MGCVCCSLSSFVSILLDALERVSLCTVCAMLTCCLLLTILIVMVMGIGIGYHYCFVQTSVEAMEKSARSMRVAFSEVNPPGQNKMLRSIDKSMRGFAHRIARRDADVIVASNMNTKNATMSDRNTNNESFPNTKTHKTTNLTVAS